VKFTSPRRQELGIDVTPLIDIVFQLVLFFMISTTFDDSPRIDIELPESSSSNILRESQNIEIWIADGGKAFVDRVPIEDGDLRAQIQSGLDRNPGMMLIIKADKKVGHGRVVELLDLAQELGVKKLSIGAQGNSE
jgi:biopolymer transport protein ExbD